MNDKTKPQPIVIDPRLSAKYADAIVAIAEAASTGKESLSEEQTAANKAREGSIADSLRAYAATTKADGVKPEVAGQILRASLAGMAFPAGTCSNYGRAVEGFHKLADAQPEKWQAMSVKDAQDAMRSPETAQKDAVRESLKPYLRDATLEQLTTILEAAKACGIVLKDRKAKARKADAVEPEVIRDQAVAA